MSSYFKYIPDSFHHLALRKAGPHDQHPTQVLQIKQTVQMLKKKTSQRLRFWLGIKIAFFSGKKQVRKSCGDFPSHIGNALFSSSSDSAQANLSCKEMLGKIIKLGWWDNTLQESYNTPPQYRTPNAILLANYERNPFMVKV